MAREIEVYALVGDRFELRSRKEGQGAVSPSLLDGFSVDLAAIF